jgi:hypothetical protein
MECALLNNKELGESDSISCLIDQFAETAIEGAAGSILAIVIPLISANEMRWTMHIIEPIDNRSKLSTAVKRSISGRGPKEGGNALQVQPISTLLPPNSFLHSLVPVNRAAFPCRFSSPSSLAGQHERQREKRGRSNGKWRRSGEEMRKERKIQIMNG